MTEALSMRLGRVIQQLRSFGQLHASELEAVAVELEESQSQDRLRGIAGIQRDELQMMVDELLDIRQGLEATQQPPQRPGGGGASPKYQKWLAEQAAETERLKQPISRRGLFDRLAPAGGEAHAIPDQGHGENEQPEAAE